MMPTQIKKELTTLPSRYLNQQLMYPGQWVLTWIKPPYMPWMLASMEPFEEGET